MKVLFIMFSGFDKPSTSEHLLSAVINQLCIEKNVVHIIQKNTGGNLPAIPQKLSGYSITTNAIPFIAAQKHDFVGRYIAELRYLNNCKKYITSEFDAVFIQSNNIAGFVLLAVRRKLPKAIVTLNVQDVFPYNAMYSGMMRRNSLAFKVLSAIQRLGYKKSNSIITISEDMKDTLISDGVDAEKVKVIYNWSYQDEIYQNLDLTPIMHLFNKKYFNVVYAGNIGTMQNVDILIEAAKLMKDEQSVWFNIIGDGVAKEKLETKAKEYGIHNISFYPIQPSKFAPLIYNAADVNVIPLAKDVYRTALPSKTATCLACQKPIIFAIGKDSKFIEKIRMTTSCEAIESDDAEGLCRIINKIKGNRVPANNESFFVTNCSIKSNSKKYSEIITHNVVTE